MTFADLFSGIGGFRLGLERAGMQCKWACEIDDFCRKVYLKHWPETEPFYEDIRTITNPPRVDLVCGGFPCQPFSVAGKRQGAEDDRNLWPEMLRVIDLVRPSWVLGENVPGVGDYLDTVVSDLEARGFEVVPLEIEAAAVGAHHRRARVWIVAHATQRQDDGRRRGELAQEAETGRRGDTATNAGSADVADADGRRYEQRDTGQRGISIPDAGSEDVPDATDIRRNGHSKIAGSTEEGEAERRMCESAGSRITEYGGWLPEPDVGRVAHGVPNRVDRLKSLGNAVVPQVVEWIGRRIMDANQ